jgi:hypothetical protein
MGVLIGSGLIHDEVTRWSEDYKRGLREFDIADPAMLAERAFRISPAKGRTSHSSKTTTCGT